MAAGYVELAEQGEGLAAEGVFDLRELVQVLTAEDGLEAVGFGVQAAPSTGAGE